MVEAFATILCVIVPFLIISGLLGWHARRKNRIERVKHTYEEIATKWHLWDEFINPYHTSATGSKKDVLKSVRPILDYTEWMDYDRFYDRAKEDKIAMLVAAFGEEK
jgi:hypothetical protein